MRNEPRERLLFRWNRNGRGARFLIWWFSSREPASTSRENLVERVHPGVPVAEQERSVAW